MRVNRLITFSADGPINVFTGLTGLQMTGFGRLAPAFARTVSVQMTSTTANLAYVMDGAYGVQADGVSPRIPSKAVGADVTAELGPSQAANQPGSQYGDPYVLPNGAAGVDVSVLWVDGTAGETVRASFDLVENKR